LQGSAVLYPSAGPAFEYFLFFSAGAVSTPTIWLANNHLLFSCRPGFKMKHKIIIGDCLESLAELPAATFQTCITSPPYYGLRDYGVNGQIGLEDSLEEHLSALVDVFRAVRRVLRPDATLWLNYGDAYQDKQLLGLPWRLAFALQADGWWLRSDIIWHKPNPMPSSVTDRPTSSHEYMFLLSPSQKYFYDADAVREPRTSPWLNGQKTGAMWRSGNIDNDHDPGVYSKPGYERRDRNLRDVWTIPIFGFSAAHFATFPPALVEPCIKAGTSEKGSCPACGAPWRRIVEATGGSIGNGAWHDHDDDIGQGQRVEDGAFNDGTYKRTTKGWKPTCECPEAPPVPCQVLDPFGGAGTTGLVADRLGRNSTMLELNPEYAELAARRIRDDAPLFTEVEVNPTQTRPKRTKDDQR
jgi:DNA modification methylase